MFDELVYWVWVQQSMGYANHRIKNILESFTTAKEFFDAGPVIWKQLGLFTAKEIKSLERYSLEKARAIVKECESLGQRIVTITDSEYPERLKNIADPPCILYTRGAIDWVESSVVIAVVGTRSATKYGLEIAYEFGERLGELGVAVVSGGALGIDCEAQRGALKAGGRVVSVLGCGLEYKYLMENEDLRESIAKTGALVTEYIPGTSAKGWHFPQRNRIMSGLSVGCLVIEAGIRSGALITANLALEQNRDLFAIPGDLRSDASKGTNRLIKECAKPVTSAEDIIEEYVNLYSYLALQAKTNKEEHGRHSSDKKRESEKSGDGSFLDLVSEEASTLYMHLGREPRSIDDLTIRTGFSAPTILMALTELEIHSAIDCKSGRRFTRA